MDSFAEAMWFLCGAVTVLLLLSLIRLVFGVSNYDLKDVTGVDGVRHDAIRHEEEVRWVRDATRDAGDTITEVRGGSCPTSSDRPQ